jgi:hypothetical protein
MPGSCCFCPTWGNATGWIVTQQSGINNFEQPVCLTGWTTHLGHWYNRLGSRVFPCFCSDCLSTTSLLRAFKVTCPVPTSNGLPRGCRDGQSAWGCINVMAAIEPIWGVDERETRTTAPDRKDSEWLREFRHCVRVFAQGWMVRAVHESSGSLIISGQSRYHDRFQGRDRLNM